MSKKGLLRGAMKSLFLVLFFLSLMVQAQFVKIEQPVGEFGYIHCVSAEHLDDDTVVRMGR